MRTETQEAIVFTTERDLRVPRPPWNAYCARRTGRARRPHHACWVTPTCPRSPRSRSRACPAVRLSAAVPDCAVVLVLDSQVDGVGVDPRQPPLAWEARTATGGSPASGRGHDGWSQPGRESCCTCRPGTRVPTRPARGGMVAVPVLEPAQDQPFYSATPTIRAASAYTIGGTVRPCTRSRSATRCSASPRSPGQRMQLGQVPLIADDPLVEIEVTDGDGWQAGGGLRLRRFRTARQAPDGRRDHRGGRLRALRETTGREHAAVRCRARQGRRGAGHAVSDGGGRRGNVSRLSCRFCAARSRTSPAWRTGRPPAAESTGRASRRPRSGRRSHCGLRNAPSPHGITRACPAGGARDRSDRVCGRGTGIGRGGCRPGSCGAGRRSGRRWQTALRATRTQRCPAGAGDPASGRAAAAGHPPGGRTALLTKASPSPRPCTPTAAGRHRRSGRQRSTAFTPTWIR